MDTKNKYIWSLFFFNSGFTGLLCYNSLISINNYSVKNSFNDILNYITVGYSIGLIISFFLQDYFFKKYKLGNKLILCAIFTYIPFLIWPILLYIIKNETLLKVITIINFFILGFFSCIFQSSNIGLASGIGYKEVSLINLGNGFAGLISNLIVIIIIMINNDWRSSLKMIFIFYSIVIVYIIFSFIIHFKFFKWFSKNLFKSIKIETRNFELTDNLEDFKVDKKKLIFEMMDLLGGMLFLYITTLIIFPNMYFKIDYEKLDSKYDIPFINWIFSIFDFIPRCFKEKFILKNTKILNILNFSRLILFIIMVIFTYKLNFISDSIILNYILLLIITLILAFSNGYLTCSIFSIGPNRFKNEVYKNNSGKYLILTMFSGIFYGFLSNLIF